MLLLSPGAVAVAVTVAPGGIYIRTHPPTRTHTHIDTHTHIHAIRDVCREGAAGSPIPPGFQTLMLQSTRLQALVLQSPTTNGFSRRRLQMPVVRPRRQWRLCSRCRRLSYLYLGSSLVPMVQTSGLWRDHEAGSDNRRVTQRGFQAQSTSWSCRMHCRDCILSVNLEHITDMHS